MFDANFLDGVRRRLHPASRSTAVDDELTNPWIAAAALAAVVLLPLIPFLVVVWLIGRTLAGVRKRVSWE